MSFQLKFTNLVSMFQSSISAFGPRPLFGVKRDGKWVWVTYSEFGKMVDQLRSSLDALGVKKGDRVAVIANNRLEWAVAAYACYTLGAAYVPMYETQLAKEWEFILNDSGAKLAFVANESVYKKVLALKGSVPSLEHVVNFEGKASDASSYEYLLNSGASRQTPTAKPGDHEVATFIYTSGTTGNPKGVRLTHLNLASNVAGMHAVIPFTIDDRTLAFLPWAHVYGNNVEVNGMMSIGASMAICEAVDKIVDNLAEVQPTVLFAVPRIWNRIYDGVQKQMASKPAVIQKLFKTGMATATKLRDRQKVSLKERLALIVARKLIFSKIVLKFGGKLKYAVSGAAALSREVGEFIDNLGVKVYEGYGMTETGPIVTCNRPGFSKIGTVGQALPGVRVEIDTTAPGSEGACGEVVAYGMGVMDGYHNLPEETAKVKTPDGGMRTGDLGCFDQDGYLKITGRVKELYKLENGKYVAPAPLEEKITLSPYISQAMVHGADRPYNVALLVPDLNNLKDWAKSSGVNASAIDELLRDEKTLKLFSQELEKYSREFKSFERVKKFVLIAEEFSTANDMLTPTMKVKRRNVLKRYESMLVGLWKQ